MHRWLIALIIDVGVRLKTRLQVARPACYPSDSPAWLRLASLCGRVPSVDNFQTWKAAISCVINVFVVHGCTHTQLGVFFVPFQMDLEDPFEPDSTARRVHIHEMNPTMMSINRLHISTMNTVISQIGQLNIHRFKTYNINNLKIYGCHDKTGPCSEPLFSFKIFFMILHEISLRMIENH